MHMYLRNMQSLRAYAYTLHRHMIYICIKSSSPPPTMDKFIFRLVWELVHLYAFIRSAQTICTISKLMIYAICCRPSLFQTQIGYCYSTERILFSVVLQRHNALGLCNLSKPQAWGDCACVRSSHFSQS